MPAPAAKLGFIGLGLMGMPMTQRLLRAGNTVHIWGRDAAKLQPAIDLGAVAWPTAAGVARAADICFICLPDTAAVESVVFGPNGITQAAAEGDILVDHSSIRPDATHDFSERLLRETGGHWIDAPVSGGPPGAADGTLAIMAGADAGDFDRVLPYFGAMGTATHVGAVGSGQTTKLINQLIVGCTMAIVAEATTLAVKSGLRPEMVTQALAGGRADSLILQHYMEKMATSDETVESHLHTIVKDLNTVHQLARTTSTHTPMLAMAREIHKVVAERGRENADVSRVIEYYQ